MKVGDKRLRLAFTSYSIVFLLSGKNLRGRNDVGDVTLFVTHGVSRGYNGGSSIGLGGAAHKETHYCRGTSTKSAFLGPVTPTAAAVGSCKASEQSSSDEK